MDILAATSVVTAGLVHHLDLASFIPFGTKAGAHRMASREEHRRRRRTSRATAVCYDLALCALLWIPAPPRSVACLLRPMSKLLQQWPMLLKPPALSRLPTWITGVTGPYGYGCGKVCELICAYILLSLKTGDAFLWPPPEAFRLGPLPGGYAVLVVLVFSAAVNLVLSLWSRHARSRGNHEGVNAMVHGSIGRKISFAEHLRLAALALGNAICEEGVSRGFFYHEFIRSGGLSKSSANFAQALAFGLWHYNGIPSGYAGVGLTFIYGFMMGILVEYGDGLSLAILAHSIADYFIFAVIVRQGLVESGDTENGKKHT